MIGLMAQYKWTKAIIFTSSGMFETGLQLTREMQDAGIEVLKPSAGPFNVMTSEIKRSGIRIVVVIIATLSDDTSTEWMASAGWAWIIPEGLKSPVLPLGCLFLQPHLLFKKGSQRFIDQVKRYTKANFNRSADLCRDRNGTSEYGTTCVESVSYCQSLGINWLSPDETNAQACPVTT